MLQAGGGQQVTDTLERNGYMSEEVPEVKLEEEIKEPVGQKVGTQGEWVAVSDCTCKPNLLFFLLW